MVNYNSAYTGPQIDAAVSLAQTSLQTIDTGWAQYSDTQYTVGAPFSVDANVDTLLPNNAGNVIDSQKPSDVTTFYDGSKVLGRNGDGILITVNAIFTPTSAGTSDAEIWFDIGGSIGQIYKRILTFPKGSGVERFINFSVSGYTLGTWEANGATAYVRANGTMTIHAIDYIITRTHKAR